MTPKYYHPATLTLIIVSGVLIIVSSVLGISGEYLAAWSIATFAMLAANTAGMLHILEIQRAQRRESDLRSQLAIARDDRHFARYVARTYSPDTTTKENK